MSQGLPTLGSPVVEAEAHAMQPMEPKMMKMMMPPIDRVEISPMPVSMEMKMVGGPGSLPPRNRMEAQR